MEVELMHQPGNSAARMIIPAGETVTAEAGAMISMSSDVQIETTTHKRGKGGVMKALRRILSGESMFLNHFTPGANGGEVIVAATLAGDMMVYDLDDEELVVQSGSFVACEEQLDVDMNWQGFKSLLSGESVFWLRIRGTGKVVLSSFGAIYQLSVDSEQIVDTGHIVAFNETLDFTISKAGKSWLQSILGGEGFVCRFNGRGTVWCQSHNASSFGRNLGPMLKPR